MKITMIYDSREEEAGRITGEVEKWTLSQGYELLSFDSGTREVSHCIGCFGCWLKTPGVCIHKRDEGEDFLKAVISSDYVLRVSRIVYGGFSTSVKNYTDRLLPLIHPYFERRDGQMHHKPRYKKYPGLLSLGWGAFDEIEEGTFSALSRANQINFFQSDLKAPLILRNREGEIGEWLVREAV